MKCTACKEEIEIFELDGPNVIEARNPITFRMGTFHTFCFGLLLEEAEETPSKNVQYKNRLDEYYTKFI